MVDTPLGKALEFLRNFGFFDVVLPFLLVFAIIFGILEKTKIFGSEGADKLPKKNINAMIAFVIALFFVSSKKVVELTSASLPMVGVIAVIIVSITMLAGFFFSKEEDFQKVGWLKWILIAFALAGIVITFLYFAGWWEIAFGSKGFLIANELTNTIWGSIVLIAFIITALILITRSGKKGGETGTK